jgi:uncharacterized RDD family membrane protein YckC
MQKDEQEQLHETLWKSQEEEPMQMTTAEVSTRARKYERENILVFWLMLVLTPLVVAWIVYDLFHLLPKPLLFVTETWLLVTFLYAVWSFLRKGPRRMVPAEPCKQFLRREFEGKCQTATTIRRWILLLVPAVLAAWWGGGPALRARQMGIKSPWLSQLHAPLPLAVTILVLAFVWFGCGNAARKAKREMERLDE